MARQYYKDSTTGQMKPIGVKVEDTLPVGTEVDYDGTDIPEGWVEVDDPNVYSTEEQVIGTYLGKPLYRKVVEYTNSQTIGNANSVTNLTIPHNISNIAQCIFADVIKSSYRFPRISWDTTNNRIAGAYISNVDTTGIIFRILYDTWASGSWQFILEYTKTSD